MSETKLISFEQAPAFFQGLRNAGSRIVQCHGTFDLIHPGLVLFFSAARAKGDALVVTLTGESFLSAHGNQPYFSESLRITALCALKFVDYVVVVPSSSPAEAITCIQPDTYCVHQSESDSCSGESDALKETLELAGGDLVCIGSETFSSAKIINNFFNHLPEEVRSQGRSLAKQYTPEAFRNVVDRFASLRVLVVGDTIFDRYSYVKVQGLTSKNRIISGRFLKEHTDPGGALAVARHIRQFTPHVRMVSMVGTEPWVDSAIRAHLPEKEDLFVRDHRITTVLKQRYVEPVSDEKEMNKLFSVNYVDVTPPPAEVIQTILRHLSSAMPEVDLVVAADFGHGFMTPEIREVLQKQAPFLALNCQTNSNNHGFNIISHQYNRCDCFSLDEQEILLSCARRGIDYHKELDALRCSLGARYAWLTRGGVETIGIDNGNHSMRWPPLEPAVTDTVGAGDAFFSVVALAAAQNVPIDLSTFLGQLAGGQAVKIVGNSHPISKEALIKSGLSLLNY
jgi:bifunctional ADP-heptose synthase (sugar kinase/adenylyltransferase)